MRRARTRAVVTLVTGVGFVMLVASSFAVRATQTEPRVFTFAAAGDHGTGPHAAAGFDQIRSSGAALFLSLRHLIYSARDRESPRCEFLETHLGPPAPPLPRS